MSAYECLCILSPSPLSSLSLSRFSLYGSSPVYVCRGRYIYVGDRCVYLAPVHIFPLHISISLFSLSLSLYKCIHIHTHMYSVSLFTLSMGMCDVCVCVCACLRPCVCVSSKSLSHELQKFSSNPISLISRGHHSGEFPPLCRRISR